MSAPIASQLNAYAAQMNALQGNLSIAQSFANQAVKAATYDQEFAYNQMKDFISINQTFLNSLKDDQRFLFTTALNLREDELNQAREDKTNVSNLMLQYPNAGITLDDTIDEATRKASEWSAVQPTGVKAPVTRMIDGVLHEWDSTTGTWTPSEIVTPPPGEITAPPNYIASFREYRNKGWTREQVENAWISQYNEGKPAGTQIKDRNEMNKNFPEIKAALDEVYRPLTPGTMEIFKQVPSVIGDWWKGLWD